MICIGSVFLTSCEEKEEKTGEIDEAIANFATIKASSTLKSDSAGSYSAENMLDGNNKTVWCEGEKGNGINTYILLENPEELKVNTLYIKNGLTTNKDSYYKNNRVKQVILEFSNGETELIELTDNMEEQKIEFAEVNTKFVKIIISDIYRGNKYNDTCITDIKIGYNQPGSEDKGISSNETNLEGNYDFFLGDLEKQLEVFGIKLYEPFTYGLIKEEMENLWIWKNKEDYSSGYFLKEDKKFFKKPYYKITNEYEGKIYYGGIKDNKPHGIGIEIQEVQKDELTEKKEFMISYIGEFKEGRYEGIGISFHIPEDEEIRVYFNLYPNSSVKDMYSVFNYPNYIGKYKEGKNEGKGNYMSYKDFMYKFYVKDENDKLTSLSYLTLYIGEFKNDKFEGKGKVYYEGILAYDGEFKNNDINGSGKIYYLETKTLKYKGELKNGLYDGKGTLYDVNGDTIYSGNWSKGDYD